MHVVFSLSEADLREAAYRNRWWEVRILRAALGCLVSGMLWGAFGPWVGLVAGVLSGGLVMLPVAEDNRKIWASPDFDLAPRRVSLDNRGVLVETALASEAYPWRAVRRIRETRQLAIFELTDDEAVVAPKSAFGTEWRAAIARARMAVDAARGEL